MKNKGFTLIELLITIAIVGILASVVLVSLSSARDKGVDVSIKTNLSNFKNEAEMYFDDNNESYDGLCGEVKPLEIFAEISRINEGNDPVCDDDTGIGAYWLVYSTLKTEPATIWCLDSTGFVGESVVLNVSDGDCAPDA